MHILNILQVSFSHVFVQNCIRDITDALIAMCEDRQEDEETAMLSNSQIIHSVVDIFGAGKRPTVKRMNVHNIVLLEVEQKNGFLSTYPELWACVHGSRSMNAYYIR